MYLKNRLVILVLSSFLCQLINKLESAMNQKSINSTSGGVSPVPQKTGKAMTSSHPLTRMGYPQGTLTRIEAIAPFVLSDFGSKIVFEHVTAYQVLCLFDESMSAHYGYEIIISKPLVNGAPVDGALCVKMNMRGGEDSNNWCCLHFIHIRNFDAIEYRKNSNNPFENADIIGEMQRIKRIDNLRALLEVITT